MTLEQKLRNSDREKIILFAVVFGGVVIRIFMAYWHFTHVDDIACLISFLGQHGTNEISQGKRFSTFFTYAPLQGIFISLLVNHSFPYKVNVFLSRLPSCFFGIFSIVIALKVVQFIAKKNIKYITILTVALLCFSWENIIYSAQAEPYTIIVFFGLLIILSAFQNFYESWKKTFIYLILFTLGCYGHYQFFILLFCYYIALFIYNLKKKDNRLRIVIIAFANLLCALPLILFFINNGRMTNGINWNRGIGDKFLLVMESPHIINNLRHFLKFFLTNSFYIFKYFFTIDSFDILSDIFACCLLLIAFIGYLQIHKKNLLMAIYSDILIVVVTLLIVMQKLTFGPSRHGLYLYPLLLLFVCYGFLFFTGFVKNKDIAVSCCKFVFAYITISFFFSLPREIGNRKNLISEKEINELVLFYKPAFLLVGEWMFDLFAMHIDGYEQKSDWHAGCEKNNWQDEDNRRVLFYSRTQNIQSIFERNDLNYLKENRVWSKTNDIKSVKTLYKKEIALQTEIEYASSLYWNYPNGCYMYIFEPILNTDSSDGGGL